MEVDYEEYARAMRKELTNREMKTKDNEINHEYFLHKKGCYFGEIEENSLLKTLGELYEPYDLTEVKQKAGLERFFDVEIELRIQYYKGKKMIKKQRGKKQE